MWLNKYIPYMDTTGTKKGAKCVVQVPEVQKNTSLTAKFATKIPIPYRELTYPSK